MENRILYRCPVCDIPMFVKVGLRLILERFYKGQPARIEIDRKDSEGVMRIACNSCGKGAHILAHIKETIMMNDPFVVKKESVVDNPVDTAIN